MSDINHKQIMAKFNDLLLKNVNPDKITAHLAQSKMITERELQALREIRSEIERKKTLLRMIADKGSEVYEEFVKALEKDNCSVAYCLVKEENAIVKEELRKTKEQLLLVKKKVAEEKGTFEKDAPRTIDDRQTRVTSDHIQLIVDDIDRHWRDLGVKLRLSTPVLDNVDADCMSPREKAWEVCLKWKKSKASGATLGVLTDALDNIGKKSSAHKLLGGVNPVVNKGGERRRGRRKKQIKHVAKRKQSKQQ